MRIQFKSLLLAALVAALSSCTTIPTAPSDVSVSSEVGNGSAAQAAELTALDRLTAAVARAESFAKAAAQASASVRASAASIAADIKSIKQSAALKAEPKPEPEQQPADMGKMPMPQPAAAGLTEGPASN
jgi:predicted lipoprotein